MPGSGRLLAVALATALGAGCSCLIDPGGPDGRPCLEGRCAPGYACQHVGAADVCVADREAPPPPVLTATVPPSPSSSQTPRIDGTAEAGATVHLFTGSDCAEPEIGDVVADAEGLFSFQASVRPGATTTFFATAQDEAGNTSACSSPGLTYVQLVAPIAEVAFASGPTTVIAGNCTSDFVLQLRDGLGQPTISPSDLSVALSSDRPAETSFFEGSGCGALLPAPETVTIPAGQTQVAFTMIGTRATAVRVAARVAGFTAIRQVLVTPAMATRLVFTSGDPSVAVDTCTPGPAPVTVALRDPHGNIVAAPDAVTVSLTGGSANVRFYALSDTSCTGAPVDQLIIAQGTDAASVRLMASVPGVYTLHATSAALDEGTQTATINSGNLAGVTVTPTNGLQTTEAGGTATFTIVLNTQPTARVSVGLSTSDPGEGTASPTTVTFTTANWSAPQTVTVTGVDDLVQDGNQPYTIITSVASSSDPSYANLPVPDVTAVNTDDDSAGVVVTPTSGLVTTEAGGSATFTIVLTTKPTANVTIGLAASDATEGVVTPASVTFTTTNWNAPQSVTVTGVNDSLQDGAQVYSVVTAPATSADPAYSGMAVPDVLVSNTDDDVAGFTVAPTSGLVTTEAGGTATFTVALNTQPTANVVIGVASSDTTEGTVAPASLVFTTANWNAPQTVTVTGADDALPDGNQPFQLFTANATSTDPTYNGLAVPDVTATNVDNDSAGVTVAPTSGLTTTEAGGTAPFTVVLNAQPTANVTINLASSNTAEGTVSPGSLTFTTASWNAPQAVTVTGVDDAVQDGNQVYTVVTSPTVSTDSAYGALTVADVSVSNVDDDSAGITVFPLTGLTTTEAGGQATFTVVLNSQPTANVTVGLSSSDATEGTVSPAALTFTQANWNAPQVVTITGVNDPVPDGAQPYTVITAPATSADPGYNTLNPPNVSVSNTDDDSAGVTVAPTSGLTTTEAGGTATFTVVLNAQPTANVTISLSSSDTTEGTVSPSALTFTPANWGSPQTVTVTGIDDALQDFNQAYVITTGAAVSADGAYSGFPVPNVGVTNIDDDSAGITVFPLAGLTTTEAGGSDTFTVVLNAQPTANVTIGLSSSDATEGTVSPASLTFTSANWSSPRPVTVTGVDDAEQDGNQVYSIVTAAAVSSDVNYNGVNAADVSVSNTDNDSAGITVFPLAGLVTTEAGGQATFTVVLNSQPSANVTIGLSSNDPTEGTVSPAALTFTPANWNAPQVGTVTGVNDAVADGAQPYAIVTAPATSADPNYSSLKPPNVAVSNTDDDSAGVTVFPTNGLTTTEAGGTAIFTVVLNAQPTANVTIALSSSDPTEGTVSPAALTFTGANWNAPQPVTVTGVDDAVQDGNQVYGIVTASAASADPNYGGMNAADVSVSNTDNDSAGISVPAGPFTTTEAGGQATFTVVLNSQPTADVTIGLSSSDPSEGTVAPAALTFTGANWNAPQTVTVTGVNDAVQDGNQVYSIVTAAAVSTDPNYSGLNAADVSMSNTDNDSAGITVNPQSGLTTTEAGGQATFTVVLSSQPTANVTIGLSSSDTTEGTVTPGALTFTPVNWNAPQVVTVTGVDDAMQDGNQPYSVITAPADSVDTNYSGMNPPNVTVTNADNDSAGFAIAVPGGCIATESGGVGTFTIALNSEPTANVTIGLSSSDPTEGTVSPSALTFTAANWSTPQVVSVTGVDDAIVDGDQIYTIVTAPAVSADANYSGRDPPNVQATTLDNE